METLAIDFIFLGELVPFRRVEGIEFTNGLSGERFAVNEEKNAPNKFRFQQSINLRDREIGFPGAGRHRDHHVMLAAQDGFLHRNNAFPLIWSKLGDLLRWRIKQITLSG